MHDVLALGAVHEAIGTVVLAVCTTLALIGAIVAWFYKRGGDEREIALALRQYAEAQVQNTEAMKALTTAFTAFRDDVISKLHAQDLRLVQIEAYQNGHKAADRDASTSGGH